MRNGIRGEKVLDRSEKPPPGPLIEINARSFPLFPSDRPLLRAIKNIPLVLIHIYIYKNTYTYMYIPGNNFISIQSIR